MGIVLRYTVPFVWSMGECIGSYTPMQTAETLLRTTSHLVLSNYPPSVVEENLHDLLPSWLAGLHREP